MQFLYNRAFAIFIGGLFAFSNIGDVASIGNEYVLMDQILMLSSSLAMLTLPVVMWRFPDYFYPRLIALLFGALLSIPFTGIVFGSLTLLFGDGFIFGLGVGFAMAILLPVMTLSGFVMMGLFLVGALVNRFQIKPDQKKQLELQKDADVFS